MLIWLMRHFCWSLLVTFSRQGNRWSRLSSLCTAASWFQMAPAVCCKSATEAAAAPNVSAESDKLQATLYQATGRTRPPPCPTSSTTAPTPPWPSSPAPRITQSGCGYTILPLPSLYLCSSMFYSLNRLNTLLRLRTLCFSFWVLGTHPSTPRLNS